MKYQNEQELKALLLNRLHSSKRIGEHTLLANELALGRTGVRADLALFGRQFIGVEIKSNFDSLRRLDRQTKVYLNHFDKLILVVAQRHLSKVEALASPSIELWVEATSGRIIRRLPQYPPRMSQPARTYDALVTLRELKRLRNKLETSNLPVDKARFRDAFERRFGNNSKRFWTQVQGRSITPSDLSALSRWQTKRDAAKALLSARESKWREWEHYFMKKNQSDHSSSVS